MFDNGSLKVNNLIRKRTSQTNRTESHYALNQLRYLPNIFVAIKPMGRMAAERTARMRKMENFVTNFSQNTNKKNNVGKGEEYGSS
jgi:hypothetical protein